MSAVYPVFEPSLPFADNFDGRSLSGDLNELDSIAVSINLTALSEFIDARTMAFELLQEDQLPASCPSIRWYPPQEGLAVIEGLLLYLQQSPERLSKHRVALIAGLKHLALLLNEAKDQNANFHLLIDL